MCSSKRFRLGLADLMQVYESIERYDLKYPPYQPRMVSQFKDVDRRGGHLCRDPPGKYSAPPSL